MRRVGYVGEGKDRDEPDAIGVAVDVGLQARVVSDLRIDIGAMRLMLLSSW